MKKVIMVIVGILCIIGIGFHNKLSDKHYQWYLNRCKKKCIRGIGDIILWFQWNMSKMHKNISLFYDRIFLSNFIKL